MYHLELSLISQQHGYINKTWIITTQSTCQYGWRKIHKVLIMTFDEELQTTWGRGDGESVFSRDRPPIGDIIQVSARIFVHMSSNIYIYIYNTMVIVEEVVDLGDMEEGEKGCKWCNCSIHVWNTQNFKKCNLENILLKNKNKDKVYIFNHCHEKY